MPTKNHSELFLPTAAIYTNLSERTSYYNSLGRVPADCRKAFFFKAPSMKGIRDVRVPEITAFFFEAPSMKGSRDVRFPENTKCVLFVFSDIIRGSVL